MESKQRVNELAESLFGEGNYTVDYREFSDGDDRTIIKHSVGWSATNYITAKIWVGRSEAWVEYYESDVMRNREVMPLDSFDPDSLESYIYHP